jgi:DNA-binding MarR family transcriptional regulator
MNKISPQINDDLLSYQTQKLRTLVSEIIQCCDDRKLYETQKFGLPYSEIKCLMLFNGERYLTVKGIAKRLDVAKSRVTKIIDGLIAKGMVSRFDDPTDARIKLISLTPVGGKKTREIEIFETDLHRKILVQMDDHERKNMLSELEVLRSAMEAVKATLI